MKLVALIALGFIAACTEQSPKNRIMGTGEKTHVSVMTDVDRLHDAIRRNDVESALKLIGMGVDAKAPDRMGTPLVALVARYTDDTRLLDALGAVNADAADALKRTPLSWAAGQNHATIAASLIERGAALESRDVSGKTPLFHAVLGNAAETTRLLVARGADVDARDALADTPLMLAAAKSNEPMVEMLLSAGADRGAVGSNGRTALMRATSPNVKHALGE